MGGVIRHRLDLIIHLIDTTSGTEISQKKIEMRRNGIPFHPASRSTATFMCINIGQDDFELQVKVYGFEEKSEWVHFDDLDGDVPVYDMFLIPDGKVRRGDALLTLEGCLPGITALQAVDIGTTDFGIREYDGQGKMTIFNPHQLRMEDVYYGLLHLSSDTYENMKIKKIVNASEVIVCLPFSGKFQRNEAIGRIVFGMVWENGKYLLKVRDNREEVQYLVQYIVNGEKKFRRIDFHDCERSVLA